MGQEHGERGYERQEMKLKMWIGWTLQSLQDMVNGFRRYSNCNPWDEGLHDLIYIFLKISLWSL